MFKKSLYLLSSACILSASTTMCYKKNHIDPSTISSVLLEGGKCDSKYSVEDMKSKGYEVESMKLQNANNGLTYIYVFKKDTIKKNIESSNLINSISNSQLKEQLKNIEKEKVLKKEKEIKLSKFENGKKLYIERCLKCHGKNAELKAHPSVRSLNELTLDELNKSIRDYSDDDKDNGMAIIQKQYTDFLSKKEIKNIYDYVQTIK